MSLPEQIAEFRRRVNTPGIAVGVVLGEKTDFATAGVTAHTRPRPVDAATVFQLGSITKAVTATAVLGLVQRGQLDLDEPVQSWLPELRTPQDQQQLSVRHLLTHTAGWQGAGFIGSEPGTATQDAVTRCMEIVASLPRLAPAGTLYAYNNWGFIILGRLVECCMRVPFQIAVRELVADPLGMASSGFCATEVEPYACSAGHVERAGRLIEVNPWLLPPSAAAAGGLAANLKDLLRFLRLHLGIIHIPAIIDTATIASMHARQGPPGGHYDTGTGGIGLGWFTQKLGAEELFLIEGAGVGHRALVMGLPHRQFGLAILANADHRAVLDLAQWILGAYLGTRTSPPRRVSLPRERVRQYAGQFIASAQRRLDIKVAGTGLELMASAARLAPNRFADLANRWTVMFDRPDAVVVCNGPDAGLRGQFLRAHGKVAAFRLDGRVFVKEPAGVDL